MPTIKRKVEMNLPQLIEWGLKNEITSKEYTCNNKDGYKSVIFSTTGTVHLNRFQTYLADDKYKVEVEEQVTEETVIPRLLTTFKKIYLKDDFGYQRVRIDEDFKIQLMLNKAEAHREKIETLHMVNDDGTHTLLWRDGKLVE